MANSGLFIAKETFHAEIDGVPVVVQKGELVKKGHAILKGREAFFDVAEDRTRPDVEDATAEPGKKRG